MSDVIPVVEPDAMKFRDSDVPITRQAWCGMGLQ